MFGGFLSFINNSTPSPSKFISQLQTLRFATKKAGGSTKNGRDSPGQRLGVKKFGGHKVIPGNIIIRQRGQKYHAGEHVGMGKDHTLFALIEGYVKFVYNAKRKFQVVSVTTENPNPVSTKVFDPDFRLKDYLINLKKSKALKSIE